MANYNLVTTAQFKPMTYDEIIKPLQQQQELHDKYEDAYAELQTQADVLRARAEAEPNSPWAMVYNSYMKDLGTAVDSLDKNGLDYNTRALFNRAKQGYSGAIKPMEDAIKTLDERAKEVRALQANNPDLIFTRKFNGDTSVQDILDNPNLSYNTINGNTLYTNSLKMAAQSSASRRQMGTTASGLQAEITGYTEQEIKDFINDPSTQPELYSALASQLSQYDINPNSSEGQRAMKYILTGAATGLTNAYETDTILGHRIKAAQLTSLNNENDPELVKAKKDLAKAQASLYQAKAEAGGSGGSGSNNVRSKQIKHPMKIRFTSSKDDNGNTVWRQADDKPWYNPSGWGSGDSFKIYSDDDIKEASEGFAIVKYSELPAGMQDAIKGSINREYGNIDLHNYYVSSKRFSKDEDNDPDLDDIELIVDPADVKIQTEGSGSTDYSNKF